MLRYRRYRVFVAFAVISLFALYRFGTSKSAWQDPIASTGRSKAHPEDLVAALSRTWRPQVAQETKKLSLDISAAKISQALHTPPPIAPVNRPVDKPPPTLAPKPVAKPAPVAENVETSSYSSIEPIHWSKKTEHYPVPSKSIIPLPTGSAKPIPKIQFAFEKESAAAKADREEKLDAIKTVFKRSWNGYRKFAWLHDEIKPVSNTSRDPFAGWGATLVDALDTLWIMGMTEEFEEAVEAVRKIDFTTTERPDIPLFETTIRYLGGFLAAYDLSERKHKLLLDKALELGEILLSAFDTPNRMPETYYYWRPSFSMNTHRASNRVVLAEIGSLSMEFTRLAQVSGQHKYYDAIARITDYLEEFQNKTRLPGMWPTYIDASGCKRIDYTLIDTPLQAPIAETLGDATIPAAAPTSTELLSPNGRKYKPLDLPDPVVFVAATEKPTAIEPSKESSKAVQPIKESSKAAAPPTTAPTNAQGEQLSPDGHKYKPLDLPSPIVFVAETSKPASKESNKNVQKRQLDLVEDGSPTVDAVASASPTADRPECEDQGFVSSAGSGNEEYTLGGMSDSTYEYLSKEWLLLGGKVDKYRSMYESSMDVVKDNLIFRPMLPNEDDILFSGKLFVGPTKPLIGNGVLEGENAHLTCFAGGMFGMGAKIYNRPEDLEIAKKLTQGCVWSYNMTATGIMPEAFIAVPCENTKSCAWNQTKYWEIIDPDAENRVSSYKLQMDTYNKQMASASAWFEAEMASFTAPPTPATPIRTAAPTKKPNNPAPGPAGMEKRQFMGEGMDPPAIPQQNPAKAIPQHAPHANLMVEGDTEDSVIAPTLPPPTPALPLRSVSPSVSTPSFPSLYSPSPPLTHEEYVNYRIKEDRLPPGVVTVRARNYILRPEAIESVWYMYRITGDPYWRSAGWKMFEAIEKHTAAINGNSAIDDVMSPNPSLNDEMESFWLAETLKYFYLLFADEGVVSLDEWVLNTEAHPFRRPA